LWVLAGFADLDRFTTRRITRASSVELAASNFGHGPADPGRDSFVRPKLMEHLSDGDSPNISAGNYCKPSYTQGKWQLLVSRLRVQS